MELLLIGLLLIWILATLVITTIWLCWTQQQNLYTFLASYQKDAADIRARETQLLIDFAEERKDLYDRLMAGTLPQYKEHKEGPDFEATETDETVDLDEAKDELMGKEE